MEHKRSIGAKVTQEEYDRVEALAKRTGRTISQVLRELIRRAESAPEPDIRLRDAGRAAP